MPKLLKSAAAMLLLACIVAAPARAGEDQFFGTLTGAALGGVVGSQFGHGDGRIAGATVGVLAGGWLGNDLGYELDNERSSSASSYAAGGYGSSTADMVARQTAAGYMPNYVAPDDSPPPESVYGDTCRQYLRPVIVNGEMRDGVGIACLQPDGTWLPAD